MLLLFTLCSPYICQHCYIHISKLTLLDSEQIPKILANSAAKSISIFCESWLTFCLSITKSVDQAALVLALTYALFPYLFIGGFTHTVSVCTVFSYVKASSHKETDFQNEESITHHYCMFEVTALNKG